MNFYYDKDADAVYFRFKVGKYAESDEVADGILVDYDDGGRIIGIEVLEASQRFPKNFSAQFRQGNIPVNVGILPRVSA